MATDGDNIPTNCSRILSVIMTWTFDLNHQMDNTTFLWFCSSVSSLNRHTDRHNTITSRLRRYPYPQHLWWQSFCSCRSRAMKPFTATSQRCWLTIQSVRRSLKTFLFGQWGHGAVQTILTAPSRNNLTYLLTYLYQYSVAATTASSLKMLLQAIHRLWCILWLSFVRPGD